MKREDTALTPAEWKIMRIAWRLQRCAARDVYAAAGARHGMSVSTVKTHLRRLVDKGYLRATRVGNSFLYQPRKPLLRSLFAAADSLLDKTVEGTTGPLLAYLLKNSRMSEAELDELRALLDAYRPAEPDSDSSSRSSSSSSASASSSSRSSSSAGAAGKGDPEGSRPGGEPKRGGGR